MFYARSGQIKVDGNNPQGQGIKERFQSALLFQMRFHVVLEQFSNVSLNRARKCGYAEIRRPWSECLEPVRGEVYLRLPPPLDTFGGSAVKS